MGHNLARSHHATSHLSCLQHNYIHAMRGEVQRSRCSPQIFTASFKLNDGETQRKKSKAQENQEPYRIQLHPHQRRHTVLPLASHRSLHTPSSFARKEKKA